MRNSKRSMAPKFQEVEIVDRKDITDDLMKLWIENLMAFNLNLDNTVRLGWMELKEHILLFQLHMRKI